jgi:hypothetical protein
LTLWVRESGDQVPIFCEDFDIFETFRWLNANWVSDISHLPVLGSDIRWSRSEGFVVNSYVLAADTVQKSIIIEFRQDLGLLSTSVELDLLREIKSKVITR